MPQAHEQPLIFVVDDEDFIASTLATILRHQGDFHAKSFTRSADALAAARLEAPDLFISDVGQPMLSGIELAIQVREHCPGCKVLLYSSQAATANLLEIARTCGHDFEVLLKPVHPADLLAKIQNLNEYMPPPAEPLQA